MASRHIRQHDHAAAWLGQELTVAEVIAMTGLWNGEDVAPGDGVSLLVARGLASDDPPAIFSALGENETAEFLAVLRRLPG